MIDLGSDLKFEMIFRLWLFIWAGFLHNWIDFVVSWCVSKILSLVIALWSWVCLIEMGMSKLDWFCWNFATFEASVFFFLEFGWLSLRWIAVLYRLHLVEIWWFVNLAQWFCFSIYELIQVWKFCLNLNLFALSWNYCLWWFFNLIGQF